MRMVGTVFHSGGNIAGTLVAARADPCHDSPHARQRHSDARKSVEQKASGLCGLRRADVEFFPLAAEEGIALEHSIATVGRGGEFDQIVPLRI
jgi:hypothetical protein